MKNDRMERREIKEMEGEDKEVTDRVNEWMNGGKDGKGMGQMDGLE